MNRILRILLCVCVMLLTPSAGAQPPQPTSCQANLTHVGGTPGRCGGIPAAIVPHWFAAVTFT